jgi:hypothetical protein
MKLRRAVVLSAVLFVLAPPARAYRPFVSTDGDVAALHAVEVELGYFGVDHTTRLNAYEVPTLVLNYGFREGFEFVAESDAAHELGTSHQVAEPQLNVKAMLRLGVLQDKPGVSLACETSLLLPSNGEYQEKPGFEEAGMASYRFLGMTFHLNGGGGVERTASLPFAVYGLIGERPLTEKLRLVGEINGEAVNTQTPENSGLVGAIWEPGWHDVAFDAGYRRGLSADVPAWTAVAGATFAFPAGGR